jgi:hypothetical protein
MQPCFPCLSNRKTDIVQRLADARDQLFPIAGLGDKRLQTYLLAHAIYRMLIGLTG